MFVVSICSVFHDLVTVYFFPLKQWYFTESLPAIHVLNCWYHCRICRCPCFSAKSSQLFFITFVALYAFDYQQTIFNIHIPKTGLQTLYLLLWSPLVRFSAGLDSELTINRTLSKNFILLVMGLLFSFYFCNATDKIIHLSVLFLSYSNCPLNSSAGKYLMMKW